jgi:hypothetical protein
MQVPEFGPHLHPQGRIEVRERLVHQEHLWPPHQRPTERDALPLAARERGRPAVEQWREAEQVGNLGHPRAGLLLRLAPHLRAEREVLPHGHVREQRVALEHHRDVARLGRDRIDHGIVDPDAPVCRPLKSRQHSQARRLPAAGGAHQDEELAVRDVEVQVLDHRVVAKQLVDSFISHLSQADLPA